MCNYTSNRPAIAMIELIFAIVVMGIVLMSAPSLMRSASESSFVAMQQEGISEAASKISMIMGYNWDEANSDQTEINPVLVSAGSPELAEVGITGFRSGTPQQSYRSFIDSDGNRVNPTLQVNLGPEVADAGVNDDIDDYNGGAGLVQVEASVADYMEGADIVIATQVDYIADAVTDVGGTYNANAITFDVNFAALAAGTTSNIKGITTTLQTNSLDVELSKTIVLRAFSCNIGNYQLEERNF